MKLSFRLAASTALALFALPALAQEADPSNYLGRIVVGYTTDGTPVYAAENTSVLEGNAVTAQGGVNKVEQVLQQTPGVTSLHQVGQPGLSVQVRGQQGAGRVETTVEGVPQNYRFKGHSNSDGFAYVDPAMVSQIGVTRGAVTTAGGFGSAGSVDFRLLSSDEVLAGKERGGLVRLSYGSNGDERSALAAVAQQTGALSLMLALSDTNSNDYENGEGEEIVATWRDSGSKVFRAGYNLGDAGTIDFLASRYDADYQYEYRMWMPANPRQPVSATNPLVNRLLANYQREAINEIYKVGYAYTGASDLIDLKADLYTTSTSNEDFAFPGSTLSNSNKGRLLETETTGFNLVNVSRSTLKQWDWTSTNGFEIATDSLGGVQGTDANPVDATASRYAIFSENVFASGAWELSAGLRFSGYDIDRGASDEALSDNSLDPKFTVAYQATDVLQPYVSISSNFRAPTIHELGGGDTSHGATDINLELKPELSTNFEIGMNIAADSVFTQGDSLTGRINAFKTDVKDYIWLDSGEKYINLDETVETSGLELELAYETAKYTAALAYANSHGTSPDDERLAPENVLTATLATHHLDGALTLGGSLHYNSNGASDLTWVYYEEKPVPAAYTLVDLFATYKLNDSMTFNAKIANATNETYTPWSGKADEGMGRSLYLGGEFRF